MKRIVEKIRDCDKIETDGLSDPIIFGNSVDSKLLVFLNDKLQIRG